MTAVILSFPGKAYSDDDKARAVDLSVAILSAPDLYPEHIIADAYSVMRAWGNAADWRAINEARETSAQIIQAHRARWPEIVVYGIAVAVALLIATGWV